MVSGFEDGDVEARACEGDGGGESVGAASDDSCLGHGCSAPHRVKEAAGAIDLIIGLYASLLLERRTSSSSKLAGLSDRWEANAVIVPFSSGAGPDTATPNTP